MYHSGYAAALLGLLELAVPFYGLRLSRKFGARQIGWALVAAFSALAVVRLITPSASFSRTEGDLAWTLLYGVVPLLLLIGMAHVETLYRERKRVEVAAVRQPTLAAAEQAEQAVPPAFDLMAQVAGSAAQQFNRHVGVIRVYAALLQHGVHDRRTAAHHQRIAEEAQRATFLGKLLLSTSGIVPVQQNPVSLPQLIVQARTALRRAVGPELRFLINCPGRLPLILADAAQIGFMLDQLVRNAREASRPGGSVEISAGVVSLGARQARMHEGARPGQFVLVTVADTGIGMSEETRKQVFVPFFTTKDRLRHPGLGLPSVCGMVKRHGGWMQVESKPGRGTRVQLFFPVAS